MEAEMVRRDAQATTQRPKLELSPKGKPLEAYKEEFQREFYRTLTADERDTLSNPGEGPELAKTKAKYQEMKKEAYTDWMEANKIPREEWQDEVLSEANQMVKDKMAEFNLPGKELKAYLIPAELLDSRATAWSFDNYGFIVVAHKDHDSTDFSSMFSNRVSHQVALHEGFHLNAEGFTQNRLEEGAADWMTREAIVELLNQGKMVNFALVYRTDAEAVGLIIDEMAETMGKDKAQSVFEKAYLSGNTEPLKQALGTRTWKKIEEIAEKYDDPFIDQEKLRQSYLVEIRSALEQGASTKSLLSSGRLPAAPASTSTAFRRK